jgi:hypothetical protein
MRACERFTLLRLSVFSLEPGIAAGLQLISPLVSAAFVNYGNIAEQSCLIIHLLSSSPDRRKTNRTFELALWRHPDGCQ